MTKYENDDNDQEAEAMEKKGKKGGKVADKKKFMAKKLKK